MYKLWNWCSGDILKWNMLYHNEQNVFLQSSKEHLGPPYVKLLSWFCALTILVLPVIPDREL